MFEISKVYDIGIAKLEVLENQISWLRLIRIREEKLKYFVIIFHESYIYKKNKVFAANSDFLIPISLQPNVADLSNQIKSN